MTVEDIQGIRVVDRGEEPSVSGELGLGLLLEHPLVVLPSVDHEHPWLLLAVLSLDLEQQ